MVCSLYCAFCCSPSLDLSSLLLLAVLFLILPLHPRFCVCSIQELPPTGDSGIEENLISIRWFVSLRARQNSWPFLHSSFHV
jgi:hypothetical protein